jgi:hypothetical protein
MRTYEKNGLKFYAIRLLLCGAALLIYFTAWRPVRIAFTEYVAYQQVQALQGPNSKYQAGMKSGALFISYDYGDSNKEFQYRPQFGFFFLIALMSLFFITRQKKYYFLLLGLHLVATILAFSFLILGASGIQVGFILTDAIMSYLTPALSLALVPLVMAHQRRPEAGR